MVDDVKEKEQFGEFCSYLLKRYSEDEKRIRVAKTREVLAMVGKGILFASLLLAPKYSRFLHTKDRDEPTWAEFNNYSNYYNIPKLRNTLKRLVKQRMVVVIENPSEQIVEITEKGKKTIFRYAIGDFNIRKPDRWDGKWRLIIYDVADNKKKSRDVLRNTLRRLGFLMLQKSVYLFPYPCRGEIDFLRTYYGLSQDVTMLVTSRIENDETYRKYFGI